MSFVVKGMEMPKHGDVLIVLEQDGKTYIKHNGCLGYSEVVEEISAPHGRLGDLDALQEQIKLSVQDAHMSVLWKQGMAYAHRLVEASKTVIEAEDGT